MKGIYIFKQNGIEIGRSENVITTHGKTTILQYMAGSTSDWASHIAVGAIGQNAAGVGNLVLDFEISRTPVSLKSYSSTSPNLLVKGTLDESFSANIYEVGVFPISNSTTFGKRSNLVITDFSSLDAWSTTGGTVTTNAFQAQSPTSPRVGSYSVNIPASTVYSNINTSFNFAGYSTIDNLDLLIGPVTATGTKNLTLTFTNTQGSTANIVYPLTTNAGYQVVSASLTSDVIALGQIVGISFTTPASLAVNIDAVRVSVTSEVDQSTALVSRSVLTTPIAKIYGSPLDIEYYIQLS